MADIPAPATPVKGGIGGSLDGAIAEAKRLPPWAWVGIGLAGFLVVMHLRNSAGSPASPAASGGPSPADTTPAPAGDSGALGLGGMGSFGVPDPASFGGTTGPTVPVTPAPIVGAGQPPIRVPVTVGPPIPPTGIVSPPPPTPTPAPAPAPAPLPIPKPPAPAPLPIPKPPAPAPAPAPPVPPRIHTVASGETLSEIGDSYQVPWTSIYDANQGVIEQTAQQLMGHSSDHGHWIFPGEKLVIPA